jgi:hypothetical protein
MLQQDGLQALRLGLHFGPMMNEGALQLRMRSGTCHAQQLAGKLRFDARKFLQLREIHVLESIDFHDGRPLLELS